jgi:hypothetical protein
MERGKTDRLHWRHTREATTGQAVFSRLHFWGEPFDEKVKIPSNDYPL